MGFFLKETDADRLRNLKPIREPKKNKNTIDPNAKGCDNCTLKQTWPTLTSPRMPIVGPKDADLLIIGEAPGLDEDREGSPFVGKSGQFLREHIPRRELDRIAFTNAVRCFPKNNQTPTPQEIHACSVHLEDDALERNFKAVLCVGGVPLSKYMGDPVTRVHGLRWPLEIGGNAAWGMAVFHPSFVLRNGGNQADEYPVFMNDMKRFFRNVDKWKKPVVEKPKPEDVIQVYDLETARALRARLQGKEIGMDIETTGLRAYERDMRVLTAAVSDGELTFAWPIDHPEAPNDWGLEFLLETCEQFVWTAHNSAFELQWLLFHGRRLRGKYEPNRFEDSMAYARVYYNREMQSGRGLALATVSRLQLGINIKELSNVDSANLIAYPLSEVLPYNGIDAWACLTAKRTMEGKIQQSNYERLLGTIRSTTEMELRGLPVDQAEASKQDVHWAAIAEAAKAKASKIYEVKEYQRQTQKEFNLGSPQDLAFVLREYGKIPLPKKSDEEGAAYSTDEPVLLQFVNDSPLIQPALDYREATKLRSTYVLPVLEVPKRFPDLQLHPTYTTMFVSTGRLSSAGPNITNYPSRQHKELRNQVVVPPGCVMLKCDEGQLEARVYAMLTRDRMLCSSIMGDEDIHTYWLSRIIEEYPTYMDRLRQKTDETEEKKLRKAGRNIIKSDFVFATFFGSSGKNVADRTEIPLEITDHMVKEFWNRYPEARKWVNDQRRQYRETGEILTLTGRSRYGVLPGNETINTPIQGTAADLVLDAQNELSRLSLEYDDPYLHPRLMVHDDLTFYVPDHDDRIEEYIDVIADCMTKVRYDWQTVPLIVEVQMGYKWGDTKEIAVIKGKYNH
jgi:uracil-DNA glycosylase family 4